MVDYISSGKYDGEMRFDYQYSKLSNGVRSLIVPIPGVESVTVLVLVKTGSRNEEESQAGISHILEHMMLKASKKYPTQLELASSIDEMGAEHNAFTSKEYTGYYITVAQRHLERAIEILSDVMVNPLLKKENLETELGVIVEEYNMYEDMPMRRAIEQFENLIYEGCEMGRFIEGTPKTILSTTREGLYNYYKRWYKGGNVLVAVVGKVEDKVDLSGFEGLESGEMERYVEAASYGKKKELIIEKKAEQAHLVVGVPALSMDDKRRYALSVARVVLGGNMSSRLFDEIREKRGLAYYVSAVLDTSIDVGYFAVRAGVKLENLEEAKKVIKKEILRLGESITAKEVKRAKEYLLGKLPLSLDSTMEVAQFVGLRALMLDELRQPSEVSEEIGKVDVEMVREVLSQVVREDELREVVVGPRG